MENKQNRRRALEDEVGNPDIWKNRDVANDKIKELGELKELIKKFEVIKNTLEIIEIKLNSGERLDEPPKELNQVKKEISQLEIEQLFKGKYDKQSAFLSIFPGAGGEDAEDWAKMLEKMYFNYAKKRNWSIKPIDNNPVIFEIKGDYAYGYLKKETGVHRLVRISPFSPEKKRHTSFALVEVLPDLPEIDEKEFRIPEEDLRVEFFRSSGPGGQNVNKVETAVRVIHQPTGISVASQVERSQTQNRQRALKILKAKLIKLMEEKQEEELSRLRTKVKPEWGNQIRSYVLNPYKLVKDHRTAEETSRVEAVLEGDLDIFIENELK
ncbi:peptide chain release factor 2 [Candidatus Wolfebacteria bacterium CG03_land_8_20_14_0_80_36_15]|uniref:Peptide chain release factor 2 n=1 Tax=Candidatus Wolfebacteria bacterium CG03_land_8_20_14_0_80_36_15 TaxID=1975067 RepID=A0A2M7B7H4_9BACT|nr:MAG: peptide chain release factor 2 [Candidatus Wolfebacteria bacterium CG03_land_8_20_14_0_80_36_15]